MISSMEAITLATKIVKKLRDAGYIAYFAGGWVRDHLMKSPSSDIDIATDAPPDKVVSLFPHTILVGLAFGVVVVIVEGHQFEVATFRKDCGYSDGRKPDSIEFSDAREDALRRDFTINGMFYDPIERVIHDYVQGAEDLEKGVIRAIGNPYERFLEDRLRMIRAVRFACRFAFSIEPETQEAILANAESLFPPVAKERVWSEFKKMAEGPNFDRALLELHRFGLLAEVFPSLRGIPLHEIKNRTFLFPKFPRETPCIVFLYELFPDASLEDLLDIFQALRVSNQELKWVEAAAKGKKILRDSEALDSFAWAQFYATPGARLFIAIEGLKKPKEEEESFFQRHQEAQGYLQRHIERLAAKQTILNAAHLLAEGIKPGTRMGILLKEAEKFSINENVEDPRSILNHLQNSPHWKVGD